MVLSEKRGLPCPLCLSEEDEVNEYILYKSRNRWVTYKLCRAPNIKKSAAEWTARDQRLHTQRAREGATGAGELRPPA
jgi:hypothetical protein